MFRDRHDAAKQLAAALSAYKGRKDVLILAIPRGALQIGEVLHSELGAPLDIIVTKKIPHPMSEEYAIGAVGPDGEWFVDPEAAVDVSRDYIERERKRLEAVVEEKYARYRGGRPMPAIRGKTVIIVDDGLATGSTMIAAVRVVRKKNPAKIVVAAPVGAADAVRKLKGIADVVVCLATPEPFFAIGQFYDRFPQVEDWEAIAILKKCP